MQRKLVGRLLLAMTLTFCGVNAFSASLGTDITYFDNRVQAGNSWWDGGLPDTRTNVSGLPVGEDQETEPGTVTDQSWDLEGMYLSGTTLSLVGGYDFSNGNGGWNTGDIFIDINPGFAPTNVDGGVGSIEPPNPGGAGYEYVIDISPAVDPGLGDTSALHYTVYAIGGLTVGSGLVGAVSFPQSDPWRLDNAYIAQHGIQLQVMATGTLTYANLGSAVGWQDGAVGTNNTAWNSAYLPIGGTHYAMSNIDLSWLTSPSFYIHYTQECGNDVLTGLVIPEPSTYVLFGLGLAALAARKKFAKAA